jgi:hypothetical protein
MVPHDGSTKFQIYLWKKTLPWPLISITAAWKSLANIFFKFPHVPDLLQIPARLSIIFPGLMGKEKHKMSQTAAATTAPNGSQARHQSQPSAISATLTTQSDDPCHQVPRLPRKVKFDEAKCHA